MDFPTAWAIQKEVGDKLDHKGRNHRLVLPKQKGSR